MRVNHSYGMFDRKIIQQHIDSVNHSQTLFLSNKTASFARAWRSRVGTKQVKIPNFKPRLVYATESMKQLTGHSIV